MKKKEIEKIPFRGGVRADKQYRNTAVAFFQDLRGESHLFVEVYENKKRELQTPWIRMVFTQKDWGLYYPDAGVWSAAGLDEEREKIGSNCKKRDNKCYMARSQGDMVWKFTGNTWERKYTTWVGVLQSLIHNIKAQRVQKREDKRADRLKEREQNTPPLPKGLEDWAKKTGIGTGHFLYYKRHGRYADITCSACGQVTEAAVRRKDTYEGQFEKIIPVPQHDSVGTCPHCGATGVYKAQGKTKGVWGHGMNCFIAQRYKDDGAVIRYVEIEKIYRLDTFLDEKEIMTGAGEKMIINGVGIRMLRSVSGLNTGDIVTFSVDVKGTVGTGTPVLQYWATTSTSSNFWARRVFGDTLFDISNEHFTRKKLTVVLNELNSSNQNDYFCVGGGYNADIIFRNIKIEKGNVATTWTPAPEDTEIGGRNLFLNTSNYTSDSPYSTTSNKVDNYTSSFNNGKTIYTTQSFKAGDVITVQAQSNLPWSNDHGNQPGTCGFWLYYGSSDLVKQGDYNFPHFLMGDSKSTSFKQAVTIPSVTNLNDIYIAFRFNTYSDGTANVTGKFWNLKLERGNVATDWTPAPEDSLESVDVEYYLSASQTSLSGGSWSTTAPTWVNGKYMWSRTVKTDGAGNKTYSPSQNGVCIAGAKGDPDPQGATGATGPQGPTGAAGKGIKSTTITYQLCASQTTAPTGTWLGSPPKTDIAKPYLWTRTVITYTDNATSTSYSVSSTFDSLFVGGRNLLKKSHQDAQKYSYPSESYFDFASWVSSIPLNGSTYTLSFWAKSTVNGDRIRVHFYNPSNIISLKGSQGQLSNAEDGQCDFILSTVLTKYWVTYTIPPNGNSTRSIIIPRMGKDIGVNGSGNVTVQWEKLEEGNIATAWTPAPEDLETRVTAAETEISNNKEQIKLKASQTEVADLKGALGDLSVYTNKKTTMVQSVTGWQYTWDTVISTKNAEIASHKDYIIFDKGNIILGDSTSASKLKLTKDSIQFKGTSDTAITPDSDATAWITGKVFHINSGEIESSLKFGNIYMKPTKNGIQIGNKAEFGERVRIGYPLSSNMQYTYSDCPLVVGSNTGAVDYYPWFAVDDGYAFIRNGIITPGDFIIKFGEYTLDRPDGSKFSGTLRPYYRADDVINMEFYVNGYVTSNKQEVIFLIPFSRPIMSTKVSISSINGLTIRQNGKYIYGSTASKPIKPSSYTATVIGGRNGLNVRAKMVMGSNEGFTDNEISKIVNNDTCAITASIKIVF